MEKKALAVYVYNATLDNEEKKHVWANEETFDRLSLEERRGQSGRARALGRPHGTKEREEIEDFLKTENRGIFRAESD